MTDYDDAGLIGIRADFSPTSYFTFGLSRLSMLGGDGNGLDSSDWGHWLYGRNDDADKDRWDDIAGGDFRLSLLWRTLRRRPVALYAVQSRIPGRYLPAETDS